MSSNTEFQQKRKIQVCDAKCSTISKPAFILGALFLTEIEMKKKMPPHIPGSSQHLLLATMFALNFCYLPLDLVLVIKCGILDILSMLTNNSCALMNQGWFAASTSAPMMLSSAVKLACNRLLQILTVVAR